MKRKIILFTLMLTSTLMFSQTEFDVLKVSQTEISGSARYSSMAGAFGALGGDVSSIKDNPAGLGIYRKSELTTTIDALIQNSNSVWNNKSTQPDLFKYGFNNIAYIIAGPTWRSENGQNGLQSSNFAISYNKIKNFNRYTLIESGSAASSITDYYATFTNNNYGYYTRDLSSDYMNSANYPINGAANPYQNTDIPWISVLAGNSGLMNEIIDTTLNKTTSWESLLNANETVTPSYSLREEGSINEFAFTWSGNFNNKLYLGANLNIQTLDYQSKSLYAETFEDGGNMSIDNVLTMNGMGANVKLGAIYVPLDFLRFGLSVHTPMLYTINMVNYADMNSSEVNNTQLTPENQIEYKQLSPLQINLSSAFIFNTKGLISVEYVYNNYKGIRLQDSNNDYNAYNDINSGINNIINNSNTLKFGGEYRFNPNFALRAGFASSSNATLPSASKVFIPNTTRTDTEYFIQNQTNYLTTGFGYRESTWYIDLAYVNKFIDESFYAYNSSNLEAAYKVNPASVKTTNNNIVLTFGLRF